MRKLFILVILLFQLSFGDILSRALERVRSLLPAPALIVVLETPADPISTEGSRLLPPMTQPPPCAIGLSYPETIVCPTPTPSRPSEGG
jgi:hypothetical protein